MSAQPCTIHNHSGPVREDFVDFPTGWRLQCEGLTHTDERCSAVQTGGAMLCDCDALRTEWRRRVIEQCVARSASQTSAPVDAQPDASLMEPSAPQAPAPTDLAASAPAQAADVVSRGAST